MTYIDRIWLGKICIFISDKLFVVELCNPIELRQLCERWAEPSRLKTGLPFQDTLVGFCITV